MNSAVVHYGEIGLKGKNRKYFEDLLVKNIEQKIDGKVIKEQGQISILFSKKINEKSVKDILSKIPGIENFSLAEKAEPNNDAILKTALELAKKLKFSTFKISAKRHHKENKLSSNEINNLLGDEIRKKLKKTVTMKNPDLDIKVEVVKDSAYISTENVKGVGGFPVDQRQKVVALLSGGFDSPVAAYMLMKRGCEVILIHFQNKNTLTKAVQNKVEQLAKQLSKFQVKTKLYIVDFESIQKEIIKKVDSRERMLIYRKVMINISSEIAIQNRAKFLVTGDSLSQVASQTIDNLEAVYQDSPKQIFTPLIGFDKNEIMDIAKRIETFEISKLPYGDCCSYFVPQHPNLRADPDKLKALVDKLEIDYKSEAKKSLVVEY